jgi:hypothetical protein
LSDFLQSSWFLFFMRKICTTFYFSKYGTKSFRRSVMGASTLCHHQCHNRSFLTTRSSSFYHFNPRYVSWHYWFQLDQYLVPKWLKFIPIIMIGIWVPYRLPMGSCSGIRLLYEKCPSCRHPIHHLGNPMVTSLEGSLFWHKWNIFPSRFATCHAHICYKPLP